ncbi:MAG: response regulator [Candidatus Obscuribacterales bacterium]|nr:response regulator [Candidatus Obscuribacterales bacterium]
MTILEPHHFKILVASKDKEEIAQIKKAFDHCDCQIIPASSMSLALFLTQKNLPDLIFSELELTDGDGFNFLGEIRQEPDLAKIPFIFLVDRSHNALTLEQAIDQGATSLFDCRLKGSDLVDLAMPILKEHQLVKTKRAEETPE